MLQRQKKRYGEFTSTVAPKPKKSKKKEAEEQKRRDDNDRENDEWMQECAPPGFVLRNNWQGGRLPLGWGGPSTQGNHGARILDS